MKTKDIHIGSVIRQKLEESSLSVAQFAQLINCDRTTVYDIFKRKSIDVDRLLLISEVLNYNFLWEMYLKDNPVLIHSAAGVFKVSIESEGDSQNQGAEEHIGICLKITR